MLAGMDVEITVEALAAHLSQPAVSKESAEPTQPTRAFCLLDVRESWEVQICALPGILHIPMGELPARLQQELHPGQHIIVVCHHGVRSLCVTHWMREQGYARTQSLAGGIDAWSGRIDPSVPTY